MMGQDKRRQYYKTCPFCNAHLDPGEQCDCKRMESQEPRQGELMSPRSISHSISMVGVPYQAPQRCAS